MTKTAGPANAWARASAFVAVGSSLVGAATTVAQEVLPHAVASFANSASGWTLVTVLLLTWTRVGPKRAAALGAVSFVSLTLGYAVAAQLRGSTYDPTLFVLVDLLVGPFVGVATSSLWAKHAWQAAAGTALLAGIGLGEAMYGLTTVSDTTNPVYWLLIGAVALALLVAMLVRRVRAVRWRLLAVVGTAVILGAFLVAYGSLGGA